MTIDGFLKSRSPAILDGALGTELERRGVPAPPPLWSAAALDTHPEIVLAIHEEYAAGGADILVANTFRTNVRALRAAGWLDRGPDLNRLAIELVREAVRRVATESRVGRGASECNPAFVAASVAPVEDCYSPQLVPDEDVLLSEHRQMIAWLRDAGPDLIWIETMGTVREARAAAQAAAEARMSAAISFVLREDGRLLGGDSLAEAVAAVEPFKPVLLGLNCIPPDGIDAHLPTLRNLTGRPLAAYAHINNATPTPGWSYTQALSPEVYTDCANRWVALGGAVVGGCCGTTPEYIHALSRRLRRGGGAS